VPNKIKEKRKKRGNCWEARYKELRTEIVGVIALSFPFDVPFSVRRNQRSSSLHSSKASQGKKITSLNGFPIRFLMLVPVEREDHHHFLSPASRAQKIKGEP